MVTLSVTDYDYGFCFPPVAWQQNLLLSWSQPLPVPLPYPKLPPLFLSMSIHKLLSTVITTLVHTTPKWARFDRSNISIQNFKIAAQALQVKLCWICHHSRTDLQLLVATYHTAIPSDQPYVLLSSKMPQASFKLTKNPASFVLNWPILPYPRKHKVLHPRTSVKACSPGPAELALSLLQHWLDLPGWPLEACFVPPPGPVRTKFLYFILLCDLLLKLGSPSDTPKSYLTNVTLTK